MSGKKIAGIFLVFCFHFATGQSRMDTIRITEVKVFGEKKVSEAGLKITRADSIAKTSTITTNLSDFVSFYTPAFIKSYGQGSVATVSFRGTSASHTQVIWNGMNLNSPMRGLADVSLMPVFFADDIYLLHGGSSLSQGSGALGGSIHLNNLPNWQISRNIMLLSGVGSFSSRKVFAKASFGNKFIKSDTRVFYESAQNDFPFFNYGVLPHRNDTLKNGDYRKSGILQEFYCRSNSEDFMALRLWLQKSNRNLPQLMSFEGAEKDEYQNDSHLRVQYEYKKYGKKFNLHFFTGFSTNRMEYYRATNEFGYVNENSESNENGFYNHLNFNRNFGNKLFFTTSFDVNLYKVRIQNKVQQSGYEKQRLESGLMANLQYKPTRRLNGMFLVRSESYDSKFIFLIPSFGAEWQVLNSKPVYIQTNIARNYHKPSLNDLYWIPGGNPELLPEEGYSGDLTILLKKEEPGFKLKNEVTVFLSKTKNWIVWHPASNGAYFWEASNVKNVLSRGIEFMSTSTFSVQKIDFFTGANYSFTRSSNQNGVSSLDKSRGKQLIYIPIHKGNFYLSAVLSGFTIKYDISYTGKRYTKSDNLESHFERVLNPYWINKISVSRQLEFNPVQINLKLDVENLFDEKYQSILWRAMPGRNFMFVVGLNYRK